MFNDQKEIPTSAGVAPAEQPAMPPLNIPEPLPAGTEIHTPVSPTAGCYPGGNN
jgi:hypothetical protein